MIDLGNDFEQIQALHAGEFPKLPAGGYVCIVTNSTAGMSKKNAPMLTLDLDICEGPYKAYFKDNDRPPKIYQNIRDKFGKISPYFKGLLKDFEDSNPNFHISGGLFDERLLVNKKIGVIFGDEEREYNGKIYTDPKPQRTTNINKIRNGDFEIPPIKRVNNVEKPPPKQDFTVNDNDFIGEEIDDSRLPF